MKRSDIMPFVSNLQNSPRRTLPPLFCLLFLGILFLTFNDTAIAVTYYVSTTGNDTTGNGTLSSPWRTIQYGVDRLQPGDTLYLRGGIYRESVSLTKRNGTSAAHITIKNYPSESPIMSGGTPITGWTQCKSTEKDLMYNPDGNGDIVNPNYQHIYKAVITTANPVLLEDGEFAFRCSDVEHAIGAYQDNSTFKKIATINNGQKVHIIDNDQTQPDGFWNGAKILIYSRLAANTTIEKTVSSFETDAGNKKFVFDTPLAYNIESTVTSQDRYTLFNHPSLITRAGEYFYTVPDGGGNVTVYLWPLNTANLNGKIEIKGDGAAFSGVYRPEPPYYRTFSYIDIEGLDCYGYGDTFYFISDARYIAWVAGTYAAKVGVSYNNAYYRANKQTSETPSAEATDWDLLIDLAQDTYLSVKDCTIRSMGSGVYAPNFSHLSFQDLTISSATGYGIYVNSGHNILIDSCTITNTGSMILGRRIDTFQITNNYLTYTVPKTHANGIAIYNDGSPEKGCRNVLIAHNIVNRIELPVSMHQPVNVVFLSNFIGGTLSQWSPDTEEGSLYFLNNTILGRLEAANTPYIASINNIRAGRYGIHNPQVSTIAFESGDYQSTAEKINDSDLIQLFVDPATDKKYDRTKPWTDADYHRNPDSTFALTGADIRPYLTTIIPYFPDYDYHKDIKGIKRSLTTPTIGAYEYTGPGNGAPIFNPIGNKSVAAGSVLTFTVKATDPDGDTLIYWATDLPQGATFDHVTKTFTWTPAKNQIGAYTVTFKVRDNTLITTATITITVGKLIIVPTDANSIQKAINLADTGDTIVVEEGRYYENINFNNKNIILKSTNPDDPDIATNTIIDGNGAGSVVTFSSSVPALIDTSMSFSTGTDGTNSWSMTKSGDVVTLSFGNIEIDYTDPFPDSVISDKINLPPMILTDITVETIPGFGNVYEATLNPIAGSMLTVTSDIDETTKMTAYVGIGGIMIAGTTWVAFSTSDNDLTNINAATPGYSAVIDNMASTGNNRTVDFSLGGTSSTLLSTLLGSAGDGTAGGTLSGQINATSSANEDTACEIAGFTITGGNAMQGGGIYIDSVCPTIEKNIITANNAVEGGGIYCRDGSALIRLNKIAGNKTTFGVGGAICGINSSATVANNLIADNTAYYGSGIMWFKGKPTIVNNTIACNSSTLNVFTCGIAVDSGEPLSFIKNNIIAFNNNGAGIYGLSELAPASFTYNNVFANSTGNYGGKLTDQTGRNGNISTDPFFFDTYNKDFHLKSSAGRWDANSQSWLTDTVTSPCIDAGDPNDNFAGELWPHGRRINMGAFGGTPQASMSESDAGSIADLNNDGIVDYVDMAIFTQKWLSNETSLHEDLNHDGIVDFKDFAILSIQ